MIYSDLEKINLPNVPGVYIFIEKNLLEEDTKKKLEESLDRKVEKADLEKLKSGILYIGKATSLKDRTKSYFSNDLLHERGLHIANMVTLSNDLVFIETRSVLESLLLENDLIKEYKPKYNTAQKDDKSYFVLVVTEEDFPRVVLVRYKDIDKENNLVLKSKFLGNIKKEIVKIKKTFGPYPSGIFAKDSLKLIRRIFPFRDKCIPYDKKQPYKKNPCFSYQIGLCPGVCAGVCDKKKYAKQIEHLLEFLEGNGEKVRADLEKEMHVFSKELKFEEAQKIRDTLFALDHIRDAHLIRKDVNEKEIRIEAYDVAHMSGENRVGAMTVFQNGVLAKHEYKKFKLSKDKNDDLEGLRELLERRFKHLEWKLPDVLVVDGDERHIKVAEEVLQSFKDEKTGEKNEEENALTLLKSIEVVAVTKGKNHKASRLTGKNDILDEYKESIVLLNHEAHRFSINYHKLLRKKKFVG